MGVILTLFKALADPTRLRILLLLRAMELAIGEIALVVGQSQPRVSRHVRILAEAGLVERRKEGSWVFLHLARTEATDAVEQMIDGLIAHSPESAMAAADSARLSAVQAERARAAAAYFGQIADQWDAIRSLHVADTVVEAELAAVLSNRTIGSLLDVGTGTGRMIALFGEAATVATGIDRSADMIRLARAKLSDLPADKVRLGIGDFYALPIEGASQTTVILHQVLHYASQPDRAVAEAARTVAEDGCLIIVDFAPHDHEELRTQHAHARLGFSDQQMARWLRDAGMSLSDVRTLDGTILTVKIWLATREPSPVMLAEERKRA